MVISLKIIDCLKNSIHELIELKTTISNQLHSTLQHGHIYRDEGKLCGHVKMLVEWARDIQGWKGLTTTTTNDIQDGGYLPCCHQIDNNDERQRSFIIVWLPRHQRRGTSCSCGKKRGGGQSDDSSSSSHCRCRPVS
jgi:hypothetical protein